MYTITRNIKILSFSLMTLGILGIAYGFYVAPKTIEESKEIIAASHDDYHSSDSHGSESYATDSNGYYSHGYDYNGYEYHYIEPREGQIIFFPCWLEHDVESSKTDDERISIAFNVRIN